MEKTAICPGTYDPLTEGHRDVIIRCSKVFKKVIVAISNNTGKDPLYSLEKRIDFARRALANIDNIDITPFEGLLVDLAEEMDAEVIVKGLRAISDFENEFQMAQINKKLKPELETMFLVTNPRYAYLSSSAVKEVAGFGGCITGLVPEEIEDEIVRSFKNGVFD
ncbi:MAG TPA: pantetheine-phosphate adenylyltransferase [Actinobacteria bacterium]|nr:pantetheine-phosphate adenylyltransferase [Actinomycetota bacterium]